MDNNLTPKQLKFAELYVTIGNASDAYRKAYNSGKMKDATINRNAKALLDNTKIATRIKEIQSTQSKSFQRTREEILADLNEIIDDYKKDGKTAAHALKSIEIINKMMGWNSADKVEISGELNIQPLFPDVSYDDADNQVE